MPNTEMSPEVGNLYPGPRVDLLPSLISFLQFCRIATDNPMGPTSLSLDTSPLMILEEFGE